MIKRKILFAGLLNILLIIGFFPNLTLAGVTGKIKGLVRDKNSGEPLVGVNIVVKGQMFGAASDTEGRYFILSVPPGTYTLNVSNIGYAKLVVKNVKVNIDHTTTVDLELEPQAIDMGQEVVVTAKRPVIQEDITNSTQFVELEELTLFVVVIREKSNGSLMVCVFHH